MDSGPLLSVLFSSGFHLTCFHPLRSVSVCAGYVHFAAASTRCRWLVGPGTWDRPTGGFQVDSATAIFFWLLPTLIGVPATEI